MDSNGLPSRLKDKAIYLVVLALLAMLLAVLHSFNSGKIDVESAKVYVQALSAIATLALLYYAYYNVVSRQQEDIAQLELAVRPILVWELEQTRSGACLSYRAIKHPIYDLRADLSLGKESICIEERHLDVSDSNPAACRSADISGFLSGGLGGGKAGILSIRFSYHSEVGGKYEFLFSKEVLRHGRGFRFQHRKILSAKYPWKKEKVSFED